jgi:SRSO17 transposase
MMLSKPTYDPEIIKGSGIEELSTNEITSKLNEYTTRYKGVFTNIAQKKYFQAYIQGLLSNLDRKSIEPIAFHFLNPKEVRGMQHFFKRSTMLETELRSIDQNQLSKSISAAGGMLNIDGSDFAKKGKHSVGVARQYCGRLGKTENCQAGVFVSYASEKGYGLANGQLYIPKCWFEDDYADRYKACGIPEKQTFKTKNKIGIEMIHQVIESKLFNIQWIGCDAAFGNDHHFLEALPDSIYFFAGIPANERIFRTWPTVHQAEDNQPATGRKRKYPRLEQTAETVKNIANDETIPWHEVILCEGAKGPIIADVKYIRCIRCDTLTKKNNYLIPIADTWLYIRRYDNGDIKYFFSNAPAGIPIERLHKASTMRWSIEQCFQECKSYLGMSHYESRTYHAWHRHMLMVMVSHLFTLELRLYYKKNAFSYHAYG